MATSIGCYGSKSYAGTGQNVSLYNESDSSSLTYKNRVNNIYTTNSNTKKAATRNSFSPANADDITKFFRLKAYDSTQDVVESPYALEAPGVESLTSSDAAEINEAVEELSARNFVQLFLDSYMSPLGSDIDYRLGKVTAIKSFFYDDQGAILHEDASVYGQYDKYGRIDTAVNLRTKIHIDGIGSKSSTSWFWNRVYKRWNTSSGLQEIPAYDEYYVNWFFPPFTSSSFGSSDSLADYARKQLAGRKWVKATTAADGTVTPGHWVYPDSSFDPSAQTFDTAKLLSMRPNPTYRKAAFKAVNDNIIFLQHIFENATGIVSTYLTEWDISLYIQEGLLSDKNGFKPSILSLCNRIMLDNPSELRTSAAFSYGLINAAVSKTALEGMTPNTATWCPSDYPLSAYWLPYISVNRGDGLDAYYSRAMKGFRMYEYLKKPFKDKLKWQDEIGAAYSGWYNWDDMKNWQALYTCQDDGLGPVDVQHMMESVNDTIFEDSTDSSGNEVEGAISTIVDVLYENDSTLGWPDTEKTESRYRNGKDSSAGVIVDHYSRDKLGNWVWSYAETTDSNGNTTYLNQDGSASSNASVNTSSDGIKILGITIPGSSLLKLFMKKSSIQSSVMGLAKSSSNGSSRKKLTSSSSSSGSSSSSSSSSDSLNTNLSMLDLGTDEAGQSANMYGVSQWTPALYGGPHGRAYSPKTLQAYFEPSNNFLLNVPRVNPGVNFSSENYNDFFQGNEYHYSPTGSENNHQYDTSRSFSKNLHFLQKGYLDFTMQKVEIVVSHHVWLDSIPEVYGNLGRSVEYCGCTRHWVEGGSTGFVSTSQRTYEHNYTDAGYEWSNYYNYANGGYYTDANGRYHTDEDPKRYYKDYIGKVRKTQYYGGSQYGGGGSRNYYVDGFELKYQVYKRRYLIKYYNREVQWRKRPLMHSNPSEYWNIVQTSVRSYSSFWYNPWNWWWRRTYQRWWNWSYYYCLRYLESCKYRLTFPNSPLKINQWTGIGKDYTKTYAEQDFIENVLGSDTDPTHTHNVFFCVSNGTSSTERFTNGPDLLIQYPCHVERYNYVGLIRHYDWRWHRHGSRCHRHCHCDIWWYYVPHNFTGEYIVVDINVANPIAYAGFKGSAWSDIGLNTYKGDKQELLNDVPSDNYRTSVAVNPWNFWDYSNGGNIKPVNWPNMYGTNTREVGIYGWGYFTCLPGMNTDFINDNLFEDPNDYLNLVRMYGSGIGNSTISSIVNNFKFYKLNGAAGYIVGTSTDDGKQYPMTGWKHYKACPCDSGLKTALKNIYSTATFYKYSTETDGNGDYVYNKPCLVYIDSAFRVAAKIATHQKAWLEYARKTFVDVIEPAEVRKLLESAVDANIVAKSDPTSEYYSTSSTYYHYWIEEAINLFGQGSTGRAKALAEFNSRIAYLTQFLQQVDKLITKRSVLWSYNNYINAYNYMNALYSKFSSENEVIEDYMYAYLSVLYEYRKYFINKRCNKMDGTLWRMRQLEGVIPMVAASMSTDSSTVDSYDDNSTSVGKHSYKVMFYDVNNTNTAKAEALADKSKYLDADRTSAVYIKVIYVDKTVAQKYITDLKAGNYDSETQRIVYIPQKDAWAELPFNDTYIYLSKDYTNNQKAIMWNKKCDEIGRTDRYKAVDSGVDECIFSVKWDAYGARALWPNSKYKAGCKDDRLSLYPTYKESTNTQKNSNYKPALISTYPYVYRETKNCPTILFDIVTGIDTDTVSDGISSGAIDVSTSGINSASDDKDVSIACTSYEYSDYWKINIPVSCRPRTAKYLTSLKIRSYRGDTEDVSETSTTVSASSGVMGYTLYPITEEQANDIPGIATDMSELVATIAENHTNTQEIEITSTSIIPTVDV